MLLEIEERPVSTLRENNRSDLRETLEIDESLVEGREVDFDGLNGLGVLLRL